MCYPGYRKNKDNLNRLVLVMAIFMAGTARLASGQRIIEFAKEQFSIETAADSRWQQSTSFRNPEVVTFREWFNIPVRGAVLDPRFLNYSYVFRPSFSQRRSSLDSNQVRVRAYNFHGIAELLSSRAFRFNISQSRANTTSLNRGLDQTGLSNYSSVNPTLIYLNPYLPVSASFTRARTSSITPVGLDLESLRQSDIRKSWQLSANNSKMNLHYRSTEYSDLVRKAENRSNIFRLSHQIGWGKGSSISTNYQFNKSKALVTLSSSSWSETIVIQHTQRTLSALNFRFTSSSSNGLNTRRRLMSWSYRMRLSKNVQTGMALSSSSARGVSSRSQIRNFGPWLGVSISLPLGAKLSGRSSTNLNLRNQKSFGSEIAHVIDEAHSVEESRVLVLFKSRIDKSTVVVSRKEDGFVFLEGLDYELIQVGQITELHVFPGSRILINDRLVISYTLSIRQRIEERVWLYNYNARLTVSKISIQHSASKREQTLSGDASRDENDGQSHQATSIVFASKTFLGQLRAHLGRSLRIEDESRYLRLEGRLSLGTSWRRTLISFFDLGVHRSSELDFESKQITMGVNSVWTVSRRLTLSNNLSMQIWSQTGSNDRNLLAYRYRMRYSIGQTLFDLAYNRDQWSSPNSRKISRMRVSLKRNF